MTKHVEKIIEITTKSLGIPVPPRRSGDDSVQALWRRYGWVPPTELRKNFPAASRTTTMA